MKMRNFLRFPFHYYLISILIELTILHYTHSGNIEKKRDVSESNTFKLSVIHLNDFHARYEETSHKSTTCKDPTKNECVGGIARIKTAVDKLKNESRNSIFLNAGDNYIGTIYYSLFRSNITTQFMNMLPHDALTLGNHEFDNGINGLIPFLDSINAPVVVCNIDASLEPSFQGKINKSVVIEKDGRKIGIIGFITHTTNVISQSGKLRFLDEITSVREEAKKLKADGIDILIGLSHSGILMDMKVAAAVEEIDLIVGGHSHTFLYSGSPPDSDIPFNDYPVVVTQTSGKKVPIVQAYAFSKYLGHIVLEFDSNGEVISWTGRPILLDNTIPKDPEVEQALIPWTNETYEMGSKKIGSTKVYLSDENNVCRKGECNIGDLITDAMVYEGVKFAGNGSWTKAPIALINSGGIRASIDEHKTDITYRDLVTVQPFGNTFDYLELQGKDLKMILENSFSQTNESKNYNNSKSVPLGRLQWSGMRVLVDVRKPPMERVVELKILCNECRVPIFEKYNPDKWYKLIIVSFLIKGGDNYQIIKEKHRNHEIGRLDLDVLIDYIQQMSPLITPLDGRLKIIHMDGNVH